MVSGELTLLPVVIIMVDFPKYGNMLPRLYELIKTLHVKYICIINNEKKQ